MLYSDKVVPVFKFLCVGGCLLVYYVVMEWCKFGVFNGFYVSMSYTMFVFV